MTGIIKKQLILPLLILFLGLFFPGNANAATLSNVSDTITTSRPSASAPLNSDQAALARQVSIVNNGSIYLTSDSAVIYKDGSLDVTNAGLNIVSMSAQIAGSPTTRNVYFTKAVTNAHHKGTAVVVNVTATHTIKFTTNSSVPAGGHIIITFPGTGTNIASPSATAFSFNGMATSAPADVKFNNATCTSVTITGSNTIDCLLTSSVSGSTTVTVLIGCTTGTTSCTVFAPRLINPTKTAAAGSADTWKITLTTKDASGVTLDTSKALVGTVEAVQVQVTVEPYLTFTISGRTDATDINTISASCGSITTNAGIDSTATFVNLGIISNNKLSKAAQQLQVSTNGSSGYAITATSSGRFINPASGFWLADANGGNGLTANNTPLPAVIAVAPPTNTAFGIHACGVRSNVNTDQWIIAGTAPDTTDGTAKFSNPWNTGTNGFYATLASYTGGPVTQEKTAVLYGATVLDTTPAGVYSNYYTYVATATF